jgi:Mrp family chromosome partitioning ATPase
VVDNEQTLFDHRPDFDPAEVMPSESQPQKMLALRRTGPLKGFIGPITSTPPPPFQEVGAELRDPRLVLLTEPDSARAASFRLLRDNILRASSPRIIAVSSGATHEGKTTCAINLALALSERPAARVLLLDGNFSAPALGEIFRIDALAAPAKDLNRPWLLPYRITEIMHGFHVAALVRPPGGPAPVFNSQWFAMAIGDLAGAGYDFLVIDAAALDGSAPVLQVIGAADGTLLTVRSGGSTARAFRHAAQQIPKGRALGVTLMDAD